MPTYVYRCKTCEHQFETVQRITEEPVKQCPECGSEVSRLLFPVGIVFKGSGFHVNDYPSSGRGGNGRKPGSKSEDESRSKEPTAAAKD
ncbi:MAG: FmdB family zinc ribbon protein [Armatimonadota bacterium]